MSSTLRNSIWLIWLLVAAAASVNNFRWEIDYFRSPGHFFYIALLCALPLILAACGLYVRLRSAGLWRWEIPALAIVCALAALLYQPVATLLAAFLFVACTSVGLRLAALMRAEAETGIETVTLGFAWGSAVFLPALFLLGLAHAYYPAVFLLLLVLPCLLFWREAVRAPAAVKHIVMNAGSSEALRHPMAGIAFFFLAPAAICALGVILSPSIAFDPLATHLASARVYATQHVLKPLPSLDYSYYPQGGESLMALAYSLGGQMAAQAISPLYWILSLLLLIAIGRKCAMSKAAVMVGVAAVALLPFVHWTGSNSKNDSIMVFFQAAALYAFLRWTETRAPAWIMAGALFLGSSFSIKHVALFGAIPLLVFFAYALLQTKTPRSRARLRLALIFCLLLAVSGLYWHVRTFVLTGNPFYPENAGQSVRPVGRYRNPVFGRFARLWEVPLRAHFDGSHAFQSPLPDPVGLALLVFLPLSILVARDKRPEGLTQRRACLFFCAAYLIYWTFIISDVRYAILPISLLVLLLLGKAVTFYEQTARAIRFSVAAAFAVVLLFGLLGIAIIEVNAPEILLFSGRIDSSTYLNRALRTYGSLAWLNQNHVESTVFAIGNCSRAYAPDPAKFYCVFRVRKQLMPAGYLILPQGQNGPSGASLDYQDPFFSVYQLGGAK
jgi:hypothetical protein